MQSNKDTQSQNNKIQINLNESLDHNDSGSPQQLHIQDKMGSTNSIQSTNHDNQLLQKHQKVKLQKQDSFQNVSSPFKKQYQQQQQQQHEDFPSQNVIAAPQLPNENQRRLQQQNQQKQLQGEQGNNLMSNSIQSEMVSRSKSPSQQHNHHTVNPIDAQDVDVCMEYDQNMDNNNLYNNNNVDLNVKNTNTGQNNNNNSYENTSQPPIPKHLQEEPLLDTQAPYWQDWMDEKKLKAESSYQLFKIPKIKQDITDSTIIGVIDQSGSMGDCFSSLATEWNAQIKEQYPKTKCCIFHNLAYEADQLQLEPEMGTTDVEAGFNLLNNVLNQDQDIEDYVTIIFVSDGQDNNQDTIFERLDKLFQQIPRWKKINFLTIGVGESFPTYLAMQLRQMYHTGENNIPPVFLVYNQHMHENWKVTFNLVNKYLKHNEPIQCDEQVQKFPWYAPNVDVYENSYVFTKNTELKSLKVNNNAVEIAPINKLTPQEVLEIGSVMLSNIQIANLKHSNNEVTYQEAVVALKVVNSLKDKYWGKGKKKKEEKEQMDALLSELKSLEKNPDLKGINGKSDGEKDQHLALKLAVGAIGAGVGLYWLAENYGEFADVMANMDFAGYQCCGECGMCDSVAQCCGCDSCGQCCGDIFSTGQECLGSCCKYFCQIMEYVGNFVCSILVD